MEAFVQGLDELDVAGGIGGVGQVGERSPEMREFLPDEVNRPGFVGGFDLTRGWSHGSTAEVPG